MSHIIIGTAGHIDHGKTALVNALTGVDTDRLKEEKERGLTIDLGFAHFSDKATIIDVPGHEKFIRNMVAGVSTIDLVLFVVAADDGVMPQTREHLDILKILQVTCGLIVITKIDLVEEDWLSLVTEDVHNLVNGSFLENAPIIPVSSVTNQGVTEVKAKIESLSSQIKRKQDKGVFWMPVDRAFTMKGFGTVITGSVLSGSVRVGDSIELLPQKQSVKIRGLQSHGKSVDKVSAGDRAAINLQSIEKEQVERGNVVAAPNYFTSSRRFDARLQLLKSAPKALGSRTRVRVHCGTTEVMARLSLIKVEKIAPGESAFVQLHLENPTSARRLDPFVVRQYSPTITIGGGVILNADAPRRKMSDPHAYLELQALEKEEPGEVLEALLLAADYSLRSIEQLSSEIAVSQNSVKRILHEWASDQKVIFLKKGGKESVIHANNFYKLKKLCLEAISDFHKKNPTKLGFHKAEFQNLVKFKADRELIDLILHEMKKERAIKEAGGLISLSEHRIHLSPELQELRSKIAELLYEEGFATSSEVEIAEKLSVSLRAIQEVLGVMIGLEEVVRADENIYFHAKRVEEAKEKIVAFLKYNREISISQFKELLDGTSRKFAMPLINHFDRLGITVRDGDVRILG